MQYYLGVDSGGSKAAYALVSQTGETISLHIGAGYARTVDRTELTVSQITQGVQDCLAQSPVELAQVRGVCFGLSYYGELSIKDAEVIRALRDAFNGTEHYITNDSEVGWAGSLACKPGVNIVAGTGAIAYGQNKAGACARAGGWAHFFSDEGSCYWLGRKAMKLFSKQADGRIPKGPLYDIVRASFSLKDDFDFIELMEREYIPSRRKVAEFQIVLEQAVTEGDQSAALIYEECTDELLLSISAVANQLGFLDERFLVSYSGGLFRPADTRDATARAKEAHVVAPLRRKVEALGGVLQKPLLEPWQGAALCAIRQFCPEALDEAARNMLKNR